MTGEEIARELIYPPKADLVQHPNGADPRWLVNARGSFGTLVMINATAFSDDSFNPPPPPPPSRQPAWLVVPARQSQLPPLTWIHDTAAISLRRWPGAASSHYTYSGFRRFRIGASPPESPTETLRSSDSSLRSHCGGWAGVYNLPSNIRDDLRKEPRRAAVGSRSLLGCGMPVLHEGDRRGRLVQQRVDEETPIACHIVLPSYLDIRAAAVNARRKEHHWSSRLHRGPVDLDRRRHQRAVGIDVVQLFAIGPPDGVDSPGGGDRPLTSGHRCSRAHCAGWDKGPHVHFRPSRLVRLVRHPPSGENMPAASRKGVFRKTNGLCSPAFPLIGTTQRSAFVSGSLL